jgi:hypothetical protein
VLEFGALYDQAVPEAAPEATTVLCTIAVSEACNMTLAANSTRGGVVLIGGGAASATNLPVTEAIGGGGPIEWTWPCQPYGDANGDLRISALDVQLLINAWGGYSAGVDFNRDGRVSALDVQVLMNNWGSTCPE